MHTNELTIRSAKQSDVEKIKNCVDRAYEHYVERIGKIPGPMLDDYSKIVNDHQTFVAVLDSKLAGVLVLIRKKGGMLLDNIAVHPEFQGRGFGRKLLEFCESKVRNLGFTQLDLYTNILMTENIRLYQQLGYVETKRTTEKGFNRVYMTKTFRGFKYNKKPSI